MKTLTFFRSVLLLIAFIAYSQLVNAQANTELSNLVAPTKVNVNLIAGTNNSTNLGSSSKGWKNLFLTGSLYLDGTKFLDNSGGTGGNTFVGATGNTSNTGTGNSGFGSHAMFSNTSGYGNTAGGNVSLENNMNGFSNTAFGSESLRNNVSGYFNTAVGQASLNASTSYDNTAVGRYALISVTTGNSNTAVGSGSSPADGTLSNVTLLGFLTTATASNSVRLGNTAVTSIGGYQNWSNISDGRYKKDIKENVPGLEFINKLNPITYHLDVAGIRSFVGEGTIGIETAEQQEMIEKGVIEKEKLICTGFIAQDVEKAATEIGYDFSGVDKPQNEKSLYGLRYAEFVVPLVKAVQELDSKNNSKDERIEQMQKQIDELKTIVAKLQLANGYANESQLKIPLTESNSYLGQNIPNPFDNSTRIPLKITTNCLSAEVQIIENATGKIVKTIPVTCNQLQINIEAGLLASGNYSYTLIVDGRVIDSKQMTLTK